MSLLTFIKKRKAKFVVVVREDTNHGVFLYKLPGAVNEQIIQIYIAGGKAISLL